MRRGFGQLALGFGLICFVAGCSGAPPLETLVPVAGSLMVNGKPLDGVTITFIPEIAKNNRGGSGTTGVDGSFKVTDLTQNLPGLAAGKYTIAYSRMRLPDVAVHFSVNPHRRRFRYAALGSGIRFLSRDSLGGSRPQFFASRENRLSPVFHQLSTSA